MDSTFGKNDFEIVNCESLYSGIFRLERCHIRHRLFNGGWSETFTREILKRRSAAAIIPYDPILDRVVLIEQFRIGSCFRGVSPWLLEIPAGVLTEEDNPETIARNESEEEAGCVITELLPICEYFVSACGSNEYLNLYCGKTDASNASGVHGLKHEHEDILVHCVSFDEAIKKLQNNEIKTSPAIISLLWLQLNREKLRTLWK
jgi:ADP-ribose pyrophosphatase